METASGSESATIIIEKCIQENNNPMGIAEIIRTNDKEIRLLLDKAKPKISVINDVGMIVISALAGSNSDNTYNKIAAPANNRINCNLMVLPLFTTL